LYKLKERIDAFKGIPSSSFSRKKYDPLQMTIGNLIANRKQQDPAFAKQYDKDNDARASRWVHTSLLPYITLTLA
jgi:hypothetical protein